MSANLSKYLAAKHNSNNNNNLPACLPQLMVLTPSHGAAATGMS